MNFVYITTDYYVNFEKPIYLQTNVNIKWKYHKKKADHSA